MATMNNYWNSDYFGYGSAEQDYERQKLEYVRSLAQQQAMAQGRALNNLGGVLGMHQQAVGTPPPKQDPQPNPVLLLTGEDE
jgi:hypothetical protein